MRLLEELVAEVWRTEELRSLGVEALRAAEEELEAALSHGAPGYREAAARAARLLASARLKKALRGARVPGDSADSALLGAVQRLAEILAELYAGEIPVSPGGRMLIEAAAPLVVGDIYVPRGAAVLASPGEVLGPLMEGRATPVVPGRRKHLKNPGLDKGARPSPESGGS